MSKFQGVLSFVSVFIIFCVSVDGTPFGETLFPFASSVQTRKSVLNNDGSVDLIQLIEKIKAFAGIKSVGKNNTITETLNTNEVKCRVGCTDNNLLDLVQNLTVCLQTCNEQETGETCKESCHSGVTSLVNVLIGCETTCREKEGRGNSGPKPDVCKRMCSLASMTFTGCEDFCLQNLDPCGPNSDEQDFALFPYLLNLQQYPRYEYITETNKCAMYMSNNDERIEFQSKEDCEKVCVRKPRKLIPLSDEEICALPMEVGPCKAALSRYYYSAEDKQCHMFSYGGCKGNANKFEKKEWCEHFCKVNKTPYLFSTDEQGLCNEPRDEGYCNASIPRFYYHAPTQECLPFVYEGCGGNGNNFETLDYCLATCTPQS